MWTHFRSLNKMYPLFAGLSSIQNALTNSITHPSSMLHPVQQFQLGCGGDHGTTPASDGLAGWNSSRTWWLSNEIGWSDFSAFTVVGAICNSWRQSSIWDFNCGDIRIWNGGISGADLSFFNVPKDNNVKIFTQKFHLNIKL